MKHHIGLTIFKLCLVQTGILTLISILLGRVYDWSPGLPSLVSLLIPIITIATFGKRAELRKLTILCSTCCLLESLINTGANFATQSFIFPLVSVFVYHVVGYLASEPVLLKRLHKYSQSKATPLSQSETTKPLEEASATHDVMEAASAENGRLLDYPLLLQKLQDIIGRITHELNLELLLPLLEETAKDALDADECHLFLWDEENWILSRDKMQTESVVTPSPKQGMAAWVLKNRQILLKSRLDSEHELAQEVSGPIEPYDVTVPLIAKNELLGILYIRGGDLSSLNLMRMMHIISNMFALALKNAQLFYHIEQMARIDGLTGILNHATFLEELEEMIEEAIELDYPLTILMGDIDFFKKFNDTYGHQVGDQVLKVVSGIWQESVPNNAIVGRYGGEEFICALPHFTIQDGYQLAENIRSCIESTPVPFKKKKLPVTISIGASELHKPAKNAQELIYLADEFLYSAKNAGRNKVVIGTGVTHLP